MRTQTAISICLLMALPAFSKTRMVKGRITTFYLETEAVYEIDGMGTKDISFVNPCQIAKIEIMKGGGTAVYGTQAVNGVVVIKTKGHKQ
jgi:outer membrane receptor for ferrienterochelin and colicin